MRGLTKAAAATALLTTPALARDDVIVEAGPPCDPNTASIVLDVQVERDVHRPLALRLGISESTLPCDPEKISLDGQALPTGPNGRGDGTFRIADGSSLVAAKWDISCFGDGSDNETAISGLALDLTLLGLDGQGIPEVGFSALVRQSAPLEFISVVTPDLAWPVEVCSQIGERTIMYTPELAAKTMTSEGLYGSNGAGGRTPAVPRRGGSHPGATCGSWRCYVKSAASKAHGIYKEMVSRIRHSCGSGKHNGATTTTQAHKQNGDDRTERPAPDSHHGLSSEEQEANDMRDDGTFQLVDQLPDGQRMKPISPTDNDFKPTLSRLSAATTSALLIPSLPPANNDLIVTLTIAGTLFLVFTLLGVTIIGSSSFHIDTHNRYQSLHHRETREERQARLSERRARIGSFFSRLFLGLFGYSEKAEDNEAQSAPRGRDLRGSNMPSTTMEQDLAGFREVADMVSSMVAAEEGRSNQFDPSPQGQQPSSASAAVRATYPGSRADEAPPPSYEMDSAEESMVADGFRYTPGGMGQSRPESQENVTQAGANSNSDRLGYGNKD